MFASRDWPVHWLEQEVSKSHLLVSFRFRARLREYKFQFVAFSDCEMGVRLRAHTDPVDVNRWANRPICLDGYCKLGSMQ